MGDQKREIFLSALYGETPVRKAVACANQTATYDQMRIIKAGWPEANSDPSYMALLAEGAHTILGLDAVRVPFCQTIEEEALGCTITPGSSENLPSIATHPYDLNQLHNPEMPANFLERGRVSVLIEAVKILKERVGTSAAIIAGVIGPFTITAELVGINDILRYSMRKPDALKPYLEISTKCVIQLAEALVAAGADAICIEDMIASMDLISPKTYRSLAKPSETALIDRIKVPTILHICGKVDPIVNDMIETGATTLSFEPKTSLDVVLEAVNKADRKVGIMGGIQTMDHLFYGDEALITEATTNAIKGGYSVVAPGCAIPPGASIENLKAMVEVVVKS